MHTQKAHAAVPRIYYRAVRADDWADPANPQIRWVPGQRVTWTDSDWAATRDHRVMAAGIHPAGAPGLFWPFRLLQVTPSAGYPVYRLARDPGQVFAAQSWQVLREVPAAAGFGPNACPRRRSVGWSPTLLRPGGRLTSRSRSLRAGLIEGKGRG